MRRSPWRPRAAADRSTSNVQKLSHLRLEGSDPRSSEAASRRSQRGATERTHLLVSEGGDGREPIRPLVLPPSLASPPPKDGDGQDRSRSEAPLAIIVEQPAAENGHDSAKSDDGADGESRAYLKSPLWWLGFILLVVGEVGNVVSYSCARLRRRRRDLSAVLVAPASLVAPLGAVALISNCFLSPLLLREKFRWSDAVRSTQIGRLAPDTGQGGIVLSIIGALTVVFSSKQTDTDARGIHRLG